MSESNNVLEENFSSKGLYIQTVDGNRSPLSDHKGADLRYYKLSCVVPDSVCITWEANETYELTFTAWNDGSKEFQAISVENRIKTFGQYYTIKQVTDDTNGKLNTVDVTATHTFYDLADNRFFIATDFSKISADDKKKYGFTVTPNVGKVVETPKGDTNKTKTTSADYTGPYGEGMIRAAAKAMNVNITDAQVQQVLNVSWHESNNKPDQQNNWDWNAQHGHPSKGLFQFIDTTFMTYALAGHTNIWSAWDQCLAVFNDSNWMWDLHVGGWNPTGHRRYGSVPNGGSYTTTTTTKDGSSEQETVTYYTAEDLCKLALNGTEWSYKVVGKFDQMPLQLETTDEKSLLDLIPSTWPGSILLPDCSVRDKNGNFTLFVYAKDEFYKEHGHRMAHLHDASDTSMDLDSSSITNIAFCEGPTQEKDTTTTTATTPTAGVGAAKVIADAKKYLGVPYVWGGPGGARGGNPFNGMDCSSFVSQVYKDFGIYVPAYTVSMEAYFHQIPRSEATTGDVGFFGPHGGTTHIELCLDNDHMIYEPQPGESCMMQRDEDYMPQWFARNDKMHAIVTAGGADTGGSADTSDDSGSTDSDTQTTEVPYFQPFIVSDDDSIKKFGRRWADTISSDTIKDPKAMKAYALTQLQPDPTLSVTVTLLDNQKPMFGDRVHLEIKPKGYTLETNEVGFEWYPLSKSSQSTVTLESTPKSILDYETETANNVKNGTAFDINKLKEFWTREEVDRFNGGKYDNSEKHLDRHDDKGDQQS